LHLSSDGGSVKAPFDWRSAEGAELGDLLRELPAGSGSSASPHLPFLAAFATNPSTLDLDLVADRVRLVSLDLRTYYEAVTGLSTIDPEPQNGGERNGFLLGFPRCREDLAGPAEQVFFWFLFLRQELGLSHCVDLSFCQSN
jgi:hypothetical protein